MPEYLHPTGGMLPARLRAVADGRDAPDDAITSELIALGHLTASGDMTPQGRVTLAKVLKP